MCSRKCWIVSFFYFFLHLPHRQFSFKDLCLSSKMYWTFNCSLGFNISPSPPHIFANLFFLKIFHVRLGKKSKSVSFLRVFVCVKAKLTLVSFFYFLYAPSPYKLQPTSDKRQPTNDKHQPTSENNNQQVTNDNQQVTNDNKQVRTTTNKWQMITNKWQMTTNK